MCISEYAHSEKWHCFREQCFTKKSFLRERRRIHILFAPLQDTVSVYIGGAKFHCVPRTEEGFERILCLRSLLFRGIALESFTFEVSSKMYQKFKILSSSTIRFRSHSFANSSITSKFGIYTWAWIPDCNWSSEWRECACFLSESRTSFFSEKNPFQRTPTHCGLQTKHGHDRPLVSTGNA